LRSISLIQVKNCSMPNTDSLINLKNYPFYQLMPLVLETLLNK
jgi:hypothetical protein